MLNTSENVVPFGQHLINCFTKCGSWLFLLTVCTIVCHISNLFDTLLNCCFLIQIWYDKIFLEIQKAQRQRDVISNWKYKVGSFLFFCVRITQFNTLFPDSLLQWDSHTTHMKLKVEFQQPLSFYFSNWKFLRNDFGVMMLDSDESGSLLDGSSADWWNHRGIVLLFNMYMINSLILQGDIWFKTTHSSKGRVK